MPILKYEKPGNWNLITSLSKGEIFIFRNYIFNAKKKFKYKNDSKFLNTLKPNTIYEKPYIYIFDSKNEDDRYILKIQDLIREANKEVSKDYKGYKLDIMGTWDSGYIVVMKNKDTNEDFDETSKRTIIKRLQAAKIIPKSSFFKIDKK